MHRYTLVQHNGLPSGVMLTSVSQATAQHIEIVGGLVFTEYDDAANAEYVLNYTGTIGLYPNVSRNGRFQPCQGMNLFIPNDNFNL